MKLILVSALFVFTLLLSPARAWDNDDLEIFDLVELVNVNFYEMMGVKQDATLAEIKRAFRNLSILTHPDKSDAPDANEKFRNLVAVYEVLKDSTKREKYDSVLKNGMPNWRSAIYYYRKARKVGLAEGAILLFVITTVCQYIVSWGVYLEKKYTMVSHSWEPLVST
jgi:DnaJ family protein C protein 1